ncbi:DNA-processing protein DprA [Mesorhizobium sp. BR1-1-14]|uniref:DNA-processing protein DprA n=1 Tax=Mesorhizobium sp. BR1-1-14 TaxID=2876655 RepID=UPI001CD0A8C8|nr:DNA-processing protein DprA [Mesorhizobium sp. BR1-1-14]MBZ9960608.1 DNA-protecting protein DprA [Mesorhizobium sp. BR1-1-14]
MPIEHLREHLPRKAAASIDSMAIADALSDANKQIDLASNDGVRIISSVDSEYPRLLIQTPDDPRILFVKGCLANTPEKSVAVIGTREPTEHGKIIAKRVAGFIVSEGWSVVSGLALGCDAIAHQATVEAQGHTVAVLAHGLHTIAPSRHMELAERILDTGGALVTEYRFGQEPLPQQFVKRDRIQAGLAQGVVMIQSDVVGGSLFASRAALDYQRRLFVVYPTDEDISKQEPKVQGNLLLADGSPEEMTDVLKCQPSDLRRLIILRSKSDYAQMVQPPAPTAPY